MLRTIRHTLCLGLIALLVLTSVALGTARGQAPAEGQLVICSGHGTKVIWVDGEGQPTQAPHYCADCVLSLIAVGPVAACIATFEATVIAQVWAKPKAQVPPKGAVSDLRARAPPAFV